MEGWHECELGDFLEIKHGYAFLGEHFANAGTHIVLTPGNFYDEGGFKYKGDKEKWYSGPVPAEYVLKEGDLIVAMTEQAEGLLGSSAIIPQSGLYLHNQRLGLVRFRDESTVDRRFVYYLFNSRLVRQQIRASASGAKIRHTAPARISNVKVRMPSLSTQRWIAEILSAYDELIESNQRRIQVLEKMVHSLYREWFVEFRFPGCETVQRIPSQLGNIPQGWVVKRIAERFQIVLGGTPSRSKSDYWENGTIPWINSGKVNELRVTEPSEFITELALEKSAAKVMPKGTTVLAITGATLGQVSYLEIDTTANQSVVGIVDTAGLMREWIYLSICDRIDGIIKRASGGAQQHINKEIVGNVILAIPPDDIAICFKRLVQPLFQQIATLIFQSTKLRQTRDLLQPKLMLGNIELRHRTQ